MGKVQSLTGKQNGFGWEHKICRKSRTVRGESTNVEVKAEGFKGKAQNLEEKQKFCEGRNGVLKMI